MYKIRLEFRLIVNGLDKPIHLNLEGNHGRKVARSFIQNVCDAVGAVAIAKEGEWE